MSNSTRIIAATLAVTLVLSALLAHLTGTGHVLPLAAITLTLIMDDLE
ncbi:hypothetical protein [Micrococcus lylae]|nr:hypothetical protein [Micrococcus lylae]WIK82141.1 hypothetical protein CJ228_011235 [Micrococcus lylae]